MPSTKDDKNRSRNLAAEIGRCPSRYASDWRAFSAWCRARGHAALPAHPGVVAVFLAAEADRGCAPATLGRVLAAIGHHHRLAGQAAPHTAAGGTVILDVLAGIRRSHRTPPARKAAADSYVVHAVLRAINGDTLADLRDRALVAFGMASALRRSELVALVVADLERGRTACACGWDAARPTRRAAA